MILALDRPQSNLLFIAILGTGCLPIQFQIASNQKPFCLANHRMFCTSIRLCNSLRKFAIGFHEEKTMILVLGLHRELFMSRAHKLTFSIRSFLSQVLELLMY